ncbi:MAG TPA: hypothetical protein PK264_24145 [Hyphomicrobiaceae bacterium]|nr:hypothetical protein [Hyphomicrobiaceae bacterium]
MSFLASFDERVRDLGFEPLALTATHLVRGALIDNAHMDPFDRMLAGQALSKGMSVISADQAIAALGVPVVW